MRTVIKGIFALLFLCLFPLNATDSGRHCFFIPPKNWIVADPKFLAPSVQIGFIANKKSGFCPSINLSTEEVNVPIQEYLKIVKGLYEADRDNHWRELGKIKTRAGDAYLTEIDTRTKWGAVRLLQLILLKEGIVYVLTAGALKEEFSQYYQEFQRAFTSLTLSSDLFMEIKDASQRAALASQFETVKNALRMQLQDFSSLEQAFSHADFQKKNWIPFQQSVVNGYTDLGAHWQVLLLKNFQKQLLTTE